MLWDAQVSAPIPTVEIGDSYLGLLDGRVQDRFVLIEGRRGTAKTRSILSVLVARGLRDPGRRALICRSTRTRLSDTVLLTLKDQVLPAFGLPVPKGNPENWHRIPLGNGSEFIPRGLDEPERSQSFECADIYVSEGVELPTLEDITSLAGAMRQAGFSDRQCIVDCNPGAPRHPLNLAAEPFPDSHRRIECKEDYLRMLAHNNRAAADGKWKRIVTSWWDNPGYCDPRAWTWTDLGKEYVETLNHLTGHFLARWRDGLWRAAEGVVFPEFDDSVHVCQPFDIPEDWPFYVGYDPGYDHPTAILWISVAPNGDCFVADEIYSGGRSVQEHCQEMRKRNTGRTVRGYYGDPQEFFSARAQGKSCATQAKECGFSFFPWPATGKNSQGMVDNVRNLLNKNKLYVFSNCDNTIMEFQTWRYKRTATGELPPGDDAFEDKDNHCMDVLKGLVTGGYLRYMGTQKLVEVLGPARPVQVLGE
jgi:phage terminase large subunit